MSFFEDASLVLIPSAQKTSKVYSVKPTDGTGDLTFTRSNDTATRVGPDGLIEKVRTNLFTYSEQLDNAAWTKVDTTIVANAVANPLNGAVTADKMTDASTATAARYTYESPTSSGTIYTSSGYFKKAEYNFVTLHAFGINGAVFNLDTGVKVSQSGGVGTITSVGDGWYRCSFSFTAGGSAVFFSQSPAGSISYAGTAGSGIYAFGLQVETGDIATDYIATTSAAVSVGPVANVPRLDYLNSSCPRLLLEPQRTNLRTNSETIDASTGTTVSLNNAASPDGYVNADKLVEDTSTGVHQTLFGTLLGGSVDSSAYCISIFAKAAGRSRISFYDNNQNTSGFSTFDLSTGTVVSGGGKIENYGNGWYRCTIFPLKDFSTTSVGFIQLISTGTTTSYTGDGTSGALLWGRQVEAGAYATSYIPTLGAAVTRGADAASKTGISSLIGQTEGTILVDFVWTGATSSFGYISLENAGTNYRIRMLYIQSTNTFGFDYIQNNVSLGNIHTFVPVIGQRYRMAWAYKSGDSAIYINGTQSALDTDAITYTDLSSLNFDNPSAPLQQVMGGGHNQALLFKTRLSNSDLAALTTI